MTLHDAQLVRPTPSLARPSATIPLLLWRSLLLFMTTLWTGGLTFYAAFVIHTAAAVLGSESTVGFITQRVTNYVNTLAALTLPLLLIDLLKSRPTRRLRTLALSLWTLLTLLQLPMYVLHPLMDRQLNPHDFAILDYAVFHPLHQTYLWLASIQILTFPLYLACLLTLWHRRDTASVAQ